MQTTRRHFLKSSAAFSLASAAFSAKAAGRFVPGQVKPWKLHDTQEFLNICCYCSGGCGTICSVRDGQLVNIEGDPDNPCNLGGLCPKGSALTGLRDIVSPKQKLINHPYRLTQPLVRRPGSKEWEPISWSQIIDEIARAIKKTRDESYTAVENGVTVNRCEGIASFGAAQLNNEEGYLVQKFARSLGVVQIDNQTRVCHSSTVSGLAPSFGRGSMTSHWCDFQNSDVILSIGANNVENHPLSSRWVHKAVDKGAKWIVVDPRFNRTASQADIFAHIRPGTDIAFFGGMINYILSNNLYQKEYVKAYTNATYLINKDFNFDVDDGLFTGWEDKEHAYDNRTWMYQTEEVIPWDSEPGANGAWINNPGVPKFNAPALKVPKKDPSLQDPHCVLNLMAKHYSRYTLEKVYEVTGIDPELLELIYKTYAASGAPEKSGNILYALGQTQHSYGSQNCRIMCVVQLLLGNVGVAGGGINALRGEPNVQGSTDIGATMDFTPGYLAWPISQKHPTLNAYLSAETYAAGYYMNKPKFMVSLLKEWFGENATAENDYCYDLLPKRSLKHNDSTIPSFQYMNEGQVKGYLVWGMNPAHSASNAKFTRHAMAKLDWLVVADWFETETASFWKAPDMDPTKINTTVYMLPAALIYEKEGSINNSGRWMQWRQKAIEPQGQAKSDFEILSRLFLRIRQIYANEGGVNPEQILKVNWNYRDPMGHLDVKSVSHALNGYNTKTGKLLDGYHQLTADGSTACGDWIFGGFYNNEVAKWDPMEQPCARRSLNDPSGLGLYSEWSFSWPANRRVLYNRASADPQGKPWNPNKMLVSWNGEKWVNNDVGDFVTSKVENGKVVQVPPNDNAFFMTWEQHSRLFAYPMKDGPMPEHYEPYESPVKNLLNGRNDSPMVQFTQWKNVQRGNAEEFPIVATSYSITEHWQSGTQTRNIPWLVEVQPQPFVEISEELAKEKGIRNGDRIRVFNKRGSIVAWAMVTVRLRPMTVNNKPVHTIGLVHHWSWASAFSTGDTMNDLTPNVGDPNSYIPEYKAFLVNVEKA
ncbi:molybdopterin-dependent oxidoreductase [Turicimonas muris]|uniref:molybdopterin-dependent oxidoreductase n=1 Tax=Turicimonas muris TaxID=1796652 RepID=UPI0024941831|nr:molybdopterin-dependent oxidoreductase [Turicimonas muris]